MGSVTVGYISYELLLKRVVRTSPSWCAAAS